MTTSIPIHKGSGVSPDVKEFAAHWAVHLENSGASFLTILKTMKKTRYNPCSNTLKSHMKEIRVNGKLEFNSSTSGRIPKLSDEEWRIIAGWILSQNNSVNYEDVLGWIDENYDIKLDKATLSRHMQNLEMTTQLVGKRARESDSFEEYCQGYLDFLVKVRDQRFMEHKHSKIVCLDFITNSYRLDRKTTIQMKGQKQKKIKMNSPQYTNSYLIPACYGKGLGLLSIMFTHDPTFNPQGPRADEVQNWCDEFNIARERIVYGQSNKKYCKESCDQVSHFQAVYREKLVDTNVVHDAGNSFKLDGEFILEEDAKMLLVFPPEQHGELSVLDNKFNAVAKNVWKSQRQNDDFSFDALLLLKCIDDVKQENITSWWKDNFMMDTKNLTLSKVKANLSKVKGRQILRETKKERYIESYNEWLGKQN